MVDFTGIMLRLAQTRPIFPSKTDVQHALAWQLHVEHPGAHPRLEYRPFPGERLYTDSWCELDGWSTAIEPDEPLSALSECPHHAHMDVAQAPGALVTT